MRGVDTKAPEFSETAAHEFRRLDLRKGEDCATALARSGAPFDEVYQLAADMGGMGFIERFRVECLRSVLVNTQERDPVVFGVVFVLLATLTLLASYLPARRVIHIDPVEVLREE